MWDVVSAEVSADLFGEMLEVVSVAGWEGMWEVVSAEVWEDLLGEVLEVVLVAGWEAVSEAVDKEHNIQFRIGLEDNHPFV